MANGLAKIKEKLSGIFDQILQPQPMDTAELAQKLIREGKARRNPDGSVILYATKPRFPF